MAFRTLAAVLLTVAPALAQAPATPYAPYVDGDTRLVVCVDITRIDPEAIADLLTRPFEEQLARMELPQAEKREAMQQVQQVSDNATRQAREVIRSWQEVGGGGVYVVLLNGAPLAIAPVAPGGDPAAMEAAWRQSQVPPEAFARSSGVLLAGTRETLERARGIRPILRPEFAEAMDALGEAAAQGVLVPSAPTREVVAGRITQLPVPRALREQLAAAVEDVEWIGVMVQSPPQVRVELVAQMSSPAAAQQAQQAVGQYFALLREDGLERVMPFDLTLFVPQSRGDHLVVALGPAEVWEVLEPFLDAPPLDPRRKLVRALALLDRERLRLRVSVSNLNGLGKALMLYEIDHGRFPESLRDEELSHYMGIDPFNPEWVAAHPRRHFLDSPRYEGPGPVDYVYIEPRADVRDDRHVAPGSVVVAYEKFDTWPALGLPVLFADYHTEVIESRERFEELLTGKDGRDD